MKQFFYLLSFILIACSFSSCSNDEMEWYGDEQNLVGTEWKSILQYYGDAGRASQLPPGVEIPNRTETLNFETKEFVIIDTRWTYNFETQKVEKIEIKDPGTYEYTHPKIKLTFADGSVVEAFISAKNTIYYSDEKKGANEFARQ